MSPITVVATGDALALRRIVERPGAPYGDLGRIVRDADVAFTNVETTLADHIGRKTPGAALSTEAAIAGDLRKMGFDLVSYANNHTMDYGEQGLSSTLKAIREAGLSVAGAGWNLHEARSPAYVEVPAGRVGLVASSATFLPGDFATHRERHHGGRAGVNPLRHQETHIVDESTLANLKRAAELTKLRGSASVFEKFASEAKTDKHVVRRATLDPRGNLPAGTDVLEFSGARFAAGENPGRVVSTADAEDCNEILKWVREVRHLSDVALVSLHCHNDEPWWGDKTVPAEFLVDFAHACIDAGADAFIGHGPHRLMGMEMYRGKPIFYSLGMFFWDIEFSTQIPGDSWVGADMRDWTPSEYYAWRPPSYFHDRTILETIVPECVFDEHELIEMRLHPVSLGWGSPLPQLGAPRLAFGDDGQRILGRFAEMSAKLGTPLEIEGGVGRFGGVPAGR